MNIKPAERLNIVSEYYFSKKLKEIRDMIASGKPVINLGIGSPDLPPSQNTIEGLKTWAEKPDVHGYQSYNGIPELRKAFSQWYSTYYHVELNPDNEILPLFGSKEGILYISLAFLNPGDEVLVPNPGYPTYSSVTNLVQAKIRYYNLKEEKCWFPDFEELKNEDLSKVKLMWVNYPNMPTGADATSELYCRIVNFGLANNILICNDNPYSFILNDDPKSILSAPGAKECTLELNSLSKAQNMAGWRIGIVAGRAELINTIIKVSSNVHSGMFLPMQQAAVRALSNPPSWYTRLNEIYEKRRSIVYQIFDLLNCYYSRNQKGLFIWAKVPDEVENVELFSNEILYNAHVFITPGFIFGSNGARYLRISLCADENKLTEAKERIKRMQK